MLASTPGGGRIRCAFEGQSSCVSEDDLDTYTIIFAALAIFIGLRLYSVLGQPAEGGRSAFFNRLSVTVVLSAVVIYVASEVPARRWPIPNPVLRTTIAPSTPTTTKTVSGPARVIDGDTVVVAGIKVRLNGVDAAELGTVRGENARRVMVTLVTGLLTCRLTGEKTYDREVGYCTTAGGIDISRAIIAQGAALACPRYDSRYIHFEQEAALAVQPRSSYCVKR
ncbi:thermonuclease family protein [Bradyrhizobium tropiciagri]|uniref:thermonuclease family protein n=1 Tax=Bradyrhizobium tropiciagri TaxID=312253 RepID=UPI001BA5C571|nr:thermonuclease family protein [Bradyrhizobium tropiciagri]MBR0873474.1 thermonuclease family protein [Bradyrhizobium tropiciagri]